MKETGEVDPWLQPEQVHKPEVTSSEINREQCRRNFWWLTGWLAIWLPLIIGGTNAVGLFTSDGLFPVSTLTYAVLALGSFCLYFIQLGRLAEMNKKSWIAWALFPFLFFFIGGLVMYFMTIGLGKRNGWL